MKMGLRDPYKPQNTSGWGQGTYSFKSYMVSSFVGKEAEGNSDITHRPETRKTPIQPKGIPWGAEGQSEKRR